MMLAVCILLITPLVGFLANSFIRWNKHVSAWLGCSSSFVSFISALYLFLDYSGKTQEILLFPWIYIKQLHVDFSILLDALSLTMILIITGVGFLIHIFSVEYMWNDKRIGRYFSYLNLFLFNMLILVLGNNLLLLFVGWEGVGLCSYLLIGFWFTKKEKAVAGMKAFIVNRIGDAFFLGCLFLCFAIFGSLDFLDLTNAESVSSTWLLILCLLMFMGAAGKSAQLPLYVWLPSAMAGPTPVSALIHAATMVTAGVYLITRTSSLWVASPLALHILAVMGVLTAFLGAYLACRNWDIKKILAYSTISQLGYMFLALGVGAFSSALFHLMTHAFFKACLFLSAGSLIHGLGGEQDIRNMGQLRKKMPYTFISFLIGSLALMGLPFLSGFFSKDEILYHTFHEGHYILWLIALLGAGLTAFYTTRTLYYAFWKPAAKDHSKAHEGGWMMNMPLCVLAFLSIIAGALNWPHFMPHIMPGHLLSRFLDPGYKAAGDIFSEIILAIVSVFFVAIIIILTVYFLKKGKLENPWLFRLNWSLDKFYQKYFTEGAMDLSTSLFRAVETDVIQKGIRMSRQYLLPLQKGFYQSGLIGSYVLFMGAGLLIFILVILFR
ncbi:MAG: NADH-quinone oxidoreductase subunit L [Bdellovibrionales bacterium]|nr:NADH-quinone oxidoreductase subunit L [Bdellovibrionales bacterium]